MMNLFKESRILNNIDIKSLKYSQSTSLIYRCNTHASQERVVSQEIFCYIFF